MQKLNEDEILHIVEQLPSARTHAEREVSAAESSLMIRFPPTYRRLLLNGLATHPLLLSLSELAQAREQAEEVLTEDEREFRLAPTDVVFAWDDIYAFYYFAGNGTDDVPVYEFNYNSVGHPTEFGRTVKHALAMFYQQLWSTQDI